MSQIEDKNARRERLQKITPSQRSEISARYRRGVKILRLVLPLVALGIIGALIITSEREPPALPIQEVSSGPVGAETPVPDLPFPERATSSTFPNLQTIEKNELVAPEFESRTRDGTAYRITAISAVQEVRQPDLILLEAPRGIFEDTPYPIEISAADGTYNQSTQFMTLNQDVRIAQEGRGVINLKTLEADLKRGELASAHPVKMEGPQGTLTANSLKVKNNGMTILLSGPAHLTLNEGFDTWVE